MPKINVRISAKQFHYFSDEVTGIEHTDPLPGTTNKINGNICYNIQFPVQGYKLCRHITVSIRKYFANLDYFASVSIEAEVIFNQVFKQ